MKKRIKNIHHKKIFNPERWMNKYKDTGKPCSCWMCSYDTKPENRFRKRKHKKKFNENSEE